VTRLAAIGAVVLAAVVLAGCGGGFHHAASTSARSCAQRAQAKALRRLQNDLADLRVAAARPAKSALKGNSATNRATDRFLHDLETAPLDNLVRNRLIDHAASALVGACQQCFQALEAERPIPAIAQGDQGACSK
jgi:hypothetical protein